MKAILLSGPKSKSLAFCSANHSTAPPTHEARPTRSPSMTANPDSSTLRPNRIGPGTRPRTIGSSSRLLGIERIRMSDGRSGSVIAIRSPSGETRGRSPVHPVFPRGSTAMRKAWDAVGVDSSSNSGDADALTSVEDAEAHPHREIPAISKRHNVPARRVELATMLTRSEPRWALQHLGRCRLSSRRLHAVRRGGLAFLPTDFGSPAGSSHRFRRDCLRHVG